MNRVQLEPAYLLHHRAYRESSVLLEVFSVRHGRLGIVARGARSARSKWGSLFQPFQRLLLSWSERGELGTLTGAEADGPPAPLSGEAVFSGWYLNELLLRMLTRHDPHPVLFDRYAQALGGLAGPASPAVLRQFEMGLLEDLGYGLHLPPDIDPDGWYAYDAEAGASACKPGEGGLRGSSLLALVAGRLDSPQSLRDARALLRAALAPHLGGKPLQTPRLLRALRAAGTSDQEPVHA